MTFLKCREDKPHFVDEDPAMAGEMQGWGHFDDILIQFLLKVLKLSFLPGKAREGYLGQQFCKCVFFFLPQSDHPKVCS